MDAESLDEVAKKLADEAVDEVFGAASKEGLDSDRVRMLEDLMDKMLSIASLTPGGCPFALAVDVFSRDLADEEFQVLIDFWWRRRHRYAAFLSRRKRDRLSLLYGTGASP